MRWVRVVDGSVEAAQLRASSVAESFQTFTSLKVRRKNVLSHTSLPPVATVDHTKKAKMMAFLSLSS
ncbi:uncharacterized protein J3R85_005354 [Psidium guajava]|nr:uncharacterized protein J3R85_005354 [Psidium guajava]